MVELLAPVGDFECLKAAVLAGADAVYFGGSLFNARNYAANFNEEKLKEAINYAKIRNVKVNFALNTLIKNSEFGSAIQLAKEVYNAGVDAIIVQDIGLASTLLKHFKEITLHASTQLTVHNLSGVKASSDLGFSRVVLSRELSYNEINKICNLTNTETEVFVHGALCMSYSGQCLMSSLIGGRSGNRGKCAQPCRMKYDLLENNNKIDSGYLLSPRDLASLTYIPDLIKAGVSCFKIEGRMKSPAYVETVTRIYRKYIDLALSDEEYIIDPQDLKDLMQVFNRGGFSEGNFNTDANKAYVYKEKANNMGILLGTVSNIDKKNSLISLKTNEKLLIGDMIMFENESYVYKISELIIDNKNVKRIDENTTKLIKIGRMKGNIKPGDKIYKMSDTELLNKVETDLVKNQKRVLINANLQVKQNGITLSLSLDSNPSIAVTKCDDTNLEQAKSNPITKERLLSQLDKLKDTPFKLNEANIDLDDNLFVQISAINNLRRLAVKDLEDKIIASFSRNEEIKLEKRKEFKEINNNKELTLLLENFDKLTTNSNFKDKFSSFKQSVKSIYLPAKFFFNKDYKDNIDFLANNFNLFIYLPTIIKETIESSYMNKVDTIINSFNIKGIVFSNISALHYVNKYKDLELRANYNFNIYNNYSVDVLKYYKFKGFTLSPELELEALQDITKHNDHNEIKSELMVYGRVPVMNIGYCLLSSTNRCFKECKRYCMNNKNYSIIDRTNEEFKLTFDNLQTVTTIYNNKITSINHGNINPDILRISLLDEELNDIDDIINHVLNDETFSSHLYTYNNLNRPV